MIDAVLLDLDGTLLHVDVDAFLGPYFDSLTRTAAGSLDADVFIQALTAATSAMMTNDAAALTNEEVFWDEFERRAKVDRAELAQPLEQYYRDEFPRLRSLTKPFPGAPAVVKELRSACDRLVLATNPLFPLVAIEERLAWAGIDPALFDLITSYENMHACKPKPAYYVEICDLIGVPPSRALMVGNEPELDIAAAAAAGLKTYLVETGYPRSDAEQAWAQLSPDGPRARASAPDGRGDLASILDFIRK